MKKVKFLLGKKSTRLVAMICAVVLIIGLVPTVMFMRSSSAVWDGSTQTQPSGSGTKADPYLIVNGANLAWMAQNVSSASNKHFKQTANIDLGSKAWTPIGKEESGISSITYDGGGYSINNLYINSPSYRFAGLFGIINKSIIKNLIVSGSIKSTYSNGSYTAGIVGILSEGSTIIGCSNLSSVVSNASKGWTSAGGVVGENRGEILSCRNTGDVSASCTESTALAGGITGDNTGKGIVGCYNTGAITASNSASNLYGGILPQNINTGATINGCYYTKGGSGVGGTSTTTKKLKNSDGKNTIIDAMNSALKTYYNSNSDVTNHFYWTYENSTDSYPVAAKKTPSKDDLNVNGIADKSYDGQPVIVTTTTKSTGMGTLSKVKYNGSVTAPSKPGTYKVTVDISDGVDYYEGTITLGSFTISKGTLSKDNFNDEIGMPTGNSKVYDGEPVILNPTLKSGLLGAENLSAVKYNGETTPPTEVGTYTATIEMKGSSAWNDGTVTLGSFTISKGTLSKDNFNDELGMPKNNSKVYDGEPVILKPTLKSGLSGAEDLSAVKYNGETTPPTEVGTYTATIEVKGSSSWNDGTVELGTFEITKATVSASDIDPGKINNFLYSMELSSNTPAANKYGYYSWENATSLAITRGPGEHTLIFTPKDTKNYDWSALDGKDGWTLNADSQTLSKTFTVNTVYVPERQIVVYFNKNAMK